MITQYTAASCVSLNKSLAMPSSVDSIPSCQDQEDHVSMGGNAAIKLYKVILNTERVLAIELFNAAQALDFRQPLRSSPKIMAIHDEFRMHVPFILNDDLMYPYIEKSNSSVNENLDHKYRNSGWNNRNIPSTAERF